MCQFSPALLGTVSRTFKLCLDLAPLLSCSTRDAASTSSRPIGIRSCEQASRCSVSQRSICNSVSVAFCPQRPCLCPSSSVIATHPTRSRVLAWRDSLVAPSWAKLALQIGLLLTSRFHGNCQVARLRLAPSSKLFANSVSLQPFDFRSVKNCMTLFTGFAPLLWTAGAALYQSLLQVNGGLRLHSWDDVRRHLHASWESVSEVLSPLAPLAKPPSEHCTTPFSSCTPPARPCWRPRTSVLVIRTEIPLVANPSWLDFRGDHHSPSSQDRWLSSASLLCSAHLCLAVRLCSLRFKGSWVPVPGCLLMGSRVFFTAVRHVFHPSGSVVSAPPALIRC